MTSIQGLYRVGKNRYFVKIGNSELPMENSQQIFRYFKRIIRGCGMEGTSESRKSEINTLQGGGKKFFSESLSWPFPTEP